MSCIVVFLCIISNIASKAQKCFIESIESLKGKEFLYSPGVKSKLNVNAEKTEVKITLVNMAGTKVVYHPSWVKGRVNKKNFFDLQFAKNNNKYIRRDSLVLKSKDGDILVLGLDQIGSKAAAIPNVSYCQMYSDKNFFDFSVLVNTDYKLELPEWLTAQKLQSKSLQSPLNKYKIFATSLNGSQSRTGKIVIYDNKGLKLTEIKLIQRSEASYWYEKPCFAVISDIHVGHNSEEGYQIKTSRILKNLSKYTPAIRNIFVVGDLVNTCKESEFYEVMHLFNDTTLIRPGIRTTFMCGNHDNFRPNGGELFDRIIKQPRHQYQIIQGYPFISISCTSNAYRGGSCYNDQALQFLSVSLEDAAKRFPGKPIFVFNHLLPRNTIIGSWENSPWMAFANGLDKLFRKYPQVIDFSGHTHISIANPNQIYQHDYTAVNDGGGRSNIFTINSARDYSIHPKIAESLTEGLIVHFDDKGNVVMERWNTSLNKKYILDWIVRPPFDGTNFTYLKDNGGVKPCFENGAKLRVTYLTSDSCNIFIPQAKDDDYVLRYLIKIRLAGHRKVIKEYNQLSMQNRGEIFRDGLLIPFSKLPSDTELVCSVVAEDGYNQRSDTLSVKFITKGK